jgi:GntR family transcriptional repressor for pyruvate dehydrogenase complex
MSSLFENIKKMNAPHQVAHQIRDAIAGGRLALGEKLPSERVLAAQLGVSRPALREAIVMLSSYGLLQCRQGEGNFVTDKFPESIFSFMGFGNSLSRDNFMYFFNCRRLFDLGMVDEIVQRVRPADLQELVAINKVFLEDADKQRFVEAEVNFHRKFIAIAANPLVEELYSMVLKFMQMSASYLLATRDIREEAHFAHKKILAALRHRDLEESRAAVTEHLRQSMLNMETYFSGNGGAR